jgi:hypothetical protein
MEQKLDRLSPLDVSNLRVEDHGLPMHVAALAILEGAPLLDASGQLRLDALRGHLERRLHQAPRLRQVLYRPRLGLGPPVWVDDARFDIRRHVRARAIRTPGDEATLLGVCSQLNEPPLDRSRPLWELWVLTGLSPPGGDRPEQPSWVSTADSARVKELERELPQPGGPRPHLGCAYAGGAIEMGPRWLTPTTCAA